MPKRNDIHTVLVIGSGPIVIGQACEFDYSGTQAIKALKEDGFRVVLVNSNPATIMTDPQNADATYLEPLTAESLTKIIEIERPDAILPTMGGQTALNLSLELHKRGVLEAYSVELIGARIGSIEKAENREQFKIAMQKIGVPVPKSAYVHTLAEAMAAYPDIGLPCMIRASFTLGGAGASVAYNQDEFQVLVRNGLDASPVSEVLIEESILGYKEFEYEMMRDCKDNVVVVCTMENVDPVGVHTGDSMAVAPQQTLPDTLFQKLRDYSLAIMREIGVDSGGSNIQFAVAPDHSKIYVIEMNPRVSRSSALASKATGYPIARIATKLAVGYTLDEIPNAITKVSKASFEPTLDYVVTKLPRFDFAKFHGAKRDLGPQMKAVGEVMALGRSFKESFQKALRSLELGLWGFAPSEVSDNLKPETLLADIRTPAPDRVYKIAQALMLGVSVEEIVDATKIDPWFVYQWAEIIEDGKRLKDLSLEKIDGHAFAAIKREGYSDAYLAHVWNISEIKLREARKALGVVPTYKRVDTCAAEFASTTNYLYSTYAYEDEVEVKKAKKVIILGSGPNRIGQGVEFDYCCVRASQALAKSGVESIMINCNPETVSTDFDTSSKLYFEPITFEDVMNIVEKENPDGVILQLGGQTPLKLAKRLHEAGVTILGTSVEAIDTAESREKFRLFANQNNLRCPESHIAHSVEEAMDFASKMAFPILLRPSYVLGGRSMEIVFSIHEVEDYLKTHGSVLALGGILMDRFLEHSIEIDVDALCDGKTVFVAGIMQHIEEAGVHSGDSSCVIPPFSISASLLQEVRATTQRIALALGVKGLLNIQFAIKDEQLYVLEVNPRASRTIPFVSKATGLALIDHAVDIMLGEKLGKISDTQVKHYSVKSPVFPFLKFREADTILGPEMKSTGEVMCSDTHWEIAYGKAQFAASNALPSSGVVFISVNDSDKNEVLEIAKQLHSLGFRIVATRGTASFLIKAGVPSEKINKVAEGRPHIVDAILNGKIQLVINTTMGKTSVHDSFSIRRTALEKSVPYFTTLAGASAAVKSISWIKKEGFNPVKLQAMLNA